ncbi:MAG: prolyl oligopeptidase family serine peptidase [bacterium]|nr:prolyl oligopeptidase family serine peptidase [bacterium]
MINILFILISFLPSLKDTISPSKWLTAGPFSTSPREGIIGVLDSIENFTPVEGAELPSFLVQGGTVKWVSRNLDSAGRVLFDYENVWWDTLQDIYGYAGTSSSNYAFATFQCKESCYAFVIGKGVSSFRLNENGYSISSYCPTPVLLKAGENRIFLSTESNFRLSFIPNNDHLILLKDVTAPDIIDTSVTFSAPMAICFMNTTDEKMCSLEVTLEKTDYVKPAKTSISTIYPFGAKKIRLDFEVIKPVAGLKELWLPVTVSYKSNKLLTDSVKIDIVKPGDQYKATFISKIDNSVQYFGVVPPLDFSPDKKYSLIVALHGAGVEAIGLAKCYTPRDWTFIVTATNRRPFGFNWEDWGTLDMLEVRQEAIKRFNIDTTKIYLMGHSMGGHGTWANGLLNADLFAALAPVSGWSFLQLYVPSILEKSVFFTHPEPLSYRNRILREYYPFVFLENAKNTGIYALHGGSDDNVPPIHGRMLTGYLKLMNYDVHYTELPGKGHWWNENDDGERGAGCINYKAIMDFFKARTRNFYPKEISYKIVTPLIRNKYYWVTIDEQDIEYQDAKIEAKVNPNSISISTQNITAFSLNLSPKLIPFGEIKFIINNTPVKFNFNKEETVSFIKKGNSFVLGKLEHKGLYKSPQLYGPIKQAYFSPFILVYGRGDANYENAYSEASFWWVNGNGFVEMIPDTEVTEEIIKNYNIILFGNPEENSFTKKINSKLPIYIKDKHIWIGKEMLSREGLSLEEIYPNPLNPNKFVVVYMGADAEGTKISHYFGPLRAQSGVPDFIIYDKSVKKKGWDGVVSTGFFDKNWKLEKQSMYKK